MSRKIKYRVWDNENKSYSDPYSSAYYALTQDGGLDFYCHGDHMMEADPNVYFIEQYTGLKDKNGEEIYEGDIAKCILGNKPIKFRDCRYWLGETLDDLFVANLRYDVEVIGNIHENPELLGDINVTNKEEE